MNYEQEITDEQLEEAEELAFNDLIDEMERVKEKKQMRDAALEMRYAAESGDWELYYEIKDEYGVDSWWELIQRASN